MESAEIAEATARIAEAAAAEATREAELALANLCASECRPRLDA